MPFARYVRCDFHIVGESDAGHFSKRGVRLFRGYGSDLQADTGFLRRAFLQFSSSARERISDRPQRRRLRLFAGPFARFSYKLVERGQRSLRLSCGQQSNGFPVRASKRTAVMSQPLNDKSYIFGNTTSTKPRPTCATKYNLCFDCNILNLSSCNGLVPCSTYIHRTLLLPSDRVHLF